MPIKLIAFDVNGTLFDDNQIFWIAINGIFPKYGKPLLPLEILQQKFGQPWTKIYRELGIDEKTASDEELYKIYNELYESQDSPTPVPYLKETLDWLTSHGIKLAIVSTQQNSVTVALLKKYGLENKFSIISGSASDKAAALEEIIRDTGIPPTEIVYVGDQEGDIINAKKANCVSVAYCAGLHSSERLKKVNPNFLIQSMAELKNLPIF